MARRLPMAHQIGHRGDQDTVVEYLALYLPGVGNVAVTLEDQRPLDDDDRPALVLSVDFDLDRIRIIDASGNTVELAR